MWIIRDYICDHCSLKFELLTNKDEIAKCEKCGRKARITLSAPKLANVQSFNPHYDLQLGAYFESAEEKSAHLKKKGQMHYSGDLSPRKTTKARFICTREQSKKI